MASAVAPHPEFDSAVETGLRELLRKLLSIIESDDKESVNNNSEKMLLDLDMDGTRYMLLRMPPPIRQQAQLSPREQEIVRMVAQGHPNKVIADCLGISLWTVSTYVRRIFAKTGVASRAAMVARVMDNTLRFDARDKGTRTEKKSVVRDAQRGAAFTG